METERVKTVMTIEEAADFLQVAVTTVRKSIAAGELLAYKRFGKWYILADDLLNYIKTGERSDQK